MDEYRDEIDYANIFHPAFSGMTIRYENTVDGNKSSTIYETIKDFNGEVLGCLPDATYYNLTKKNFPNSKIIQLDSFSDLGYKASNALSTLGDRNIPYRESEVTRTFIQEWLVGL